MSARRAGVLRWGTKPLRTRHVKLGLAIASAIPTSRYRSVLTLPPPALVRSHVPAHPGLNIQSGHRTWPRASSERDSRGQATNTTGSHPPCSTTSHDTPPSHPAFGIYARRVLVCLRECPATQVEGAHRSNLVSFPCPASLLFPSSPMQRHSS